MSIGQLGFWVCFAVCLCFGLAGNLEVSAIYSAAAIVISSLRPR